MLYINDDASIQEITKALESEFGFADVELFEGSSKDGYWTTLIFSAGKHTYITDMHDIRIEHEINY